MLLALVCTRSPIALDLTPPRKGALESSSGCRKAHCCIAAWPQLLVPCSIGRIGLAIPVCRSIHAKDKEAWCMLHAAQVIRQLPINTRALLPASDVPTIAT